MKLFILCSAIAAVAASASAAPIFPIQDFATITNGELNGQGGWAFSGTNSTPVINVSSTSLFTYPAIPVTGKKVDMGDTGQDVGISLGAALTPANGNTYYYSLIIQHDGTDVGTVTGDYIAHFTGDVVTTSGAFRGRLFVAQGGTANTIRFGIRWGSNDTVQYTTDSIPANQPAFVVVKITEVASAIVPTAAAGNDTASLFVFSGPVPVPSVEPAPVATASNGIATNVSQDIVDTGNSIGRFGLRQGNAAAGAKVSVAQIRTGTTWADVVPAAANVGQWSMYH